MIPFDKERFIHYFYPFSDLQDKVYMRTSLIGKHRKRKRANICLMILRLQKTSKRRLIC